MKSNPSLEAITEVLNRTPMSAAEKIGLQICIRTIEDSLNQLDTLRRELESIKQEKLKSAKAEASNKEAKKTEEPHPGMENVTIAPTESADIPEPTKIPSKPSDSKE